MSIHISQVKGTLRKERQTSLSNGQGVGNSCFLRLSKTWSTLFSSVSLRHHLFCLLAKVWAEFIYLFCLLSDENIYFYLQSKNCNTHISRYLNSSDGIIKMIITRIIFHIYIIYKYFLAKPQGMHPDQGSNPHPLQWKCRVLTSGPPGKKSLILFIFLCFSWMFVPTFPLGSGWMSLNVFLKTRTGFIWVPVVIGLQHYLCPLPLSICWLEKGSVAVKWERVEYREMLRGCCLEKKANGALADGVRAAAIVFTKCIKLRVSHS